MRFIRYWGVTMLLTNQMSKIQKKCRCGLKRRMSDDYTVYVGDVEDLEKFSRRKAPPTEVVLYLCSLTDEQIRTALFDDLKEVTLFSSGAALERTRKSIVERLYRLRSLSALYCSDTYLCDDIFCRWPYAIPCSTLKKLEVNSCRMSKHSHCVLIKTLPFMTRLKSLKWKRPQFLIAEFVLTTFTIFSLKTLYLDVGNVHGIHALALHQQLQNQSNPSSLTRVHLYSTTERLDSAFFCRLVVKVDSIKTVHITRWGTWDEPGPEDTMKRQTYLVEQAWSDMQGHIKCRLYKWWIH